MIGASPSTYPVARHDLSDGSAGVVWSKVNETLHHRFAVGRPFIRKLAANPTSSTPVAWDDHH